MKHVWDHFVRERKDRRQKGKSAFLKYFKENGERRKISLLKYYFTKIFFFRKFAVESVKEGQNAKYFSIDISHDNLIYNIYLLTNISDTSYLIYHSLYLRIKYYRVTFILLIF